MPHELETKPSTFGRHRSPLYAQSRSLGSDKPARPAIPQRSVIVRGLAAAAFAVALATPLLADAAFTSAGGTSSAKFNASGPGGLAIVGKNDNSVSVGEEGGNLKVTVALASLDTGVKLRNQHMTEKYLETGKYPNAVLVVPRANLKVPAIGQTSSGDTDGTMTIHGQSAPVKVHYDVTNDNGTYRVVGKTPLDVRTFGINVPSYLGVTVKPNIDTEVRFNVKDQ